MDFFIPRLECATADSLRAARWASGRVHLESLTYERDGLVVRAQVGCALRLQGRGPVPISAPQVLQLVDDGASVWVQTEAEHVWDAWYEVGPEEIRQRRVFDDEPVVADVAAS